MGKGKLAKFAEMAALPNVVECPFPQTDTDFALRGRWGTDFFGNDRPIVLELGCGRGEYTVGLARLFPDMNFIGVDIKGARMWSGATEAQREGLNIQREVTGLKGSNAQGAQTVQRVGDHIHVRYVITADRDYEYVRLLCPRPAAAEPDSQISGYRWQGGLACYRAVHDASSEYFIDRLPRGTYVIEEDWLLARSGSYVLSPALLQCLYAPEFQAHTAGGQVGIVP